MKNKTVLISGAGIAGPTLAFWLKAGGYEPTLMERHLRTGGYVVDFWGLGYDIAERMGLKKDIERVGYHAKEVRVVDDRSKRVSGFDVDVFRELTNGRYVTLGRSELSHLLFDKAASTSEVMFDNEIVSLENREDDVGVEFRHGVARQFDLVVGADGLHSQVRRLAFGPQHRFEKNLGYEFAAFEVSGYRPRDEDVYVMYSRQGGRSGGSPCVKIGHCFCSSSRSATMPCQTRSTARRSCFAPFTPMTSGNASTFSMNWKARRNSISTESAKSGCRAGHEAGSSSLVTPPSAFPCWPGKAPRLP